MSKKIKESGKEWFLIIVHDRHCDDSYHFYSDRDKAIIKARKLAKEYCRFPEDYQEESIEGWEFYANYSCESDYVKVIRLKEYVEVEDD